MSRPQQQGWPIFKPIAPQDLAPIPAIAATAFVALAIFAWTERTVLVDPEGLSVPLETRGMGVASTHALLT